MQNKSSEFDDLMLRLQLDNPVVGGAFVVYHNGQCIVSSCVGQARNGEAWTANTLALNFSTGKGVLATLIHVLVSQGLLDYDRPIADYWQEFGCYGKENICLRQVLAHQTDVFKIDSLITHCSDMQHWSDMLDRVAHYRSTMNKGVYKHGTQSTKHKEANKDNQDEKYSSTYNAFVYGWILGGVIEAVTKISLQEALDTYLAQPLGIVGEIYFTLPNDKVKQVAHLLKNFTVTDNNQNITQENSRIIRKSSKPVLKADTQATLQSYQLLPAFPLWKNKWQAQTKQEKKVVQNAVTTLTTQINSLYFDAKLLHLSSYKSSLMPNNKREEDYYETEYLEATIPALNCIASAEALAKMYAMLANKGSFYNHELQRNQELISPRVFKKLSEIQSIGMDTVMPASIKEADTPNSMLWRLGYHRVFSLHDSFDNAFGHSGYNASMAWCDPDKNISVVYVHNYDSTLLTDIRQFALIESVRDMFSEYVL